MGKCPGKAKFESYLPKGQDRIQALIMFTGKHWTPTDHKRYLLSAMIQYSKWDEMGDKEKLTTHTMAKIPTAKF